MAYIEYVNIKNFKSQQTNITDKVGRGERNERNDVMLIQTLFKIIGNRDASAIAKFGLSMQELPEPTGIFDVKTDQAIQAFQRKMAQRLLSVDGKVHPADYDNRSLNGGPSARLMMITLLNYLAIDNAFMSNLGELIPAVKRISPKIVFAQKPTNKGKK